MENRVKVAVVGAGYWGKNLIRNFDALGVLAAICDNRKDVLEAFSKEYPHASTTDSFQAVLENPAIGAIAVASPAEMHYRMVKEGLLADKEVFVEKPLALHEREGVELYELAEQKKKILMVGHLLQYHPAVTKLKQLVSDGELGKVQYVYSNRLNLGKIRREENILWSFAPHDIAIILRLMDSLPFQVAACGGSYVQPNIADVTVTNLLFDNGVRAHIHVSWLHPFKEQRLVVIGSNKMASFDDVAKRLVLYDQRVEVKEGQPVPVKGNGDEVAFAQDEPLRLECQAFLHAMATRQPPLTDGRSGLNVLRVLQTAQRSLIMNGEVMTLPIDAVRL